MRAQIQAQRVHVTGCELDFISNIACKVWETYTMGSVTIPYKTRGPWFAQTYSQSKVRTGVQVQENKYV